MKPVQRQPVAVREQIRGRHEREIGIAAEMLEQSRVPAVHESASAASHRRRHERVVQADEEDARARVRGADLLDRVSMRVEHLSITASGSGGAALRQSLPPQRSLPPIETMITFDSREQRAARSGGRAARAGPRVRAPFTPTL